MTKADEELREQLSKTIERDAMALICNNCEGGGYDYENSKDCDTCKGTGISEWRNDYLLDQLESIVATERKKAVQQFAAEVKGNLPDIQEKNFYRNEFDQLICATCNSDVFGGICDCYPHNKLLAEVVAAIDEALESYES